MQGAFVYPDHDNSRVTVFGVSLGYYYGDLTWTGYLDRREIPDIMVEPVWIFNGTSESGDQMQILVPAKDIAGITDARCTNLPLSKPVELNFTLPQQHLIETSGMVSIETGRDTVARHMDIQNDRVQYNGSLMLWCGNYRYVQYEYIADSITVRIDKKSGDIVYADYTKMYPDSNNITLSLDKGRDIARQYAETIVPEFSKNNNGEPGIFNITKGPEYPRNAYRYTWQRLWIDIDPETGNILSYENWNRIVSLQCSYKETRF